VREIGNAALAYCYCLRNVAFPPNADISDYNIFIEEEEEDDEMDKPTDLQELFGSIAEIINELQHRFDGLLIHSMIYYQSYNQGVLQHLFAAINMTSGQGGTLNRKVDPTGNQQDCLGMTPLHILTCSSVHDIEVYRVIVENYPTNLITEDWWGALPLLYAFWGAAPAQIIQFLLGSYQSLYPDHVFNWTNMVWTMGRCDASKESIENLLQVKQMHFPDQPIDLGFLFDEFAKPSYVSNSSIFIERTDFKWEKDNFHIIRRIRAKVAHFEGELPKLKEITTILELALWNMRINQANETHRLRQQCRITCGADFVIKHVLPYIITAAGEESDSESDSDDESYNSLTS
jgi:hypothetical protein